MDYRLARLAVEMKAGTTILHHIPIVPLGETASLGTTEPARKQTSKTTQGDTPILQDHSCSTQKCLETAPTGTTPSSQATAQRLHLNTNFRYNSQATAACTTAEPSAGGKFRPPLITRDERHEKAIALWMNTTIGLITHWNSANHTQHGLGYLSNWHARAMPVLATNRLNNEQLRELEEIFEQVKDLPHAARQRGMEGPGEDRSGPEGADRTGSRPGDIGEGGPAPLRMVPGTNGRREEGKGQGQAV